jgi:uncharacterized lipoprotein YmbA
MRPQRALCAWGLLLCSCGYSLGSGLPERGVRTVHVQVVGNATWRQRLEAELTAALSRELSVSSGLLPAGERAADAVLEVELQDERERTLVTGSRTDPVREGAEEVHVRVRLRANRDGRLLVDRRIADRAEFRSPIGENLASARAELVADLARKIALALEAGF